MNWPSPDNGSQNSWTTRTVVGILAFVLLIGIGYYNGRKAHPEIFDTEAVVRPDPNAPKHPNSYPQIELNEEEMEDAGQQTKPASLPGKKKSSSVIKDTPSTVKATQKAQAISGSPAAFTSPSAADSKQPKASASPQTAPISSPSKADGTIQSANRSKKAAAPPAAPTASPEKRPNSQPGSSVSPAPAATVDPNEVADLVYDDSWPSPQNHPRTESTFLQRIPSMLFFLTLVCALIWISLRIIAPFSSRLTGNAASKKQINVIERKSLGPNKAVVLIEVSGKRLVLGLTEKTISTLAELECPPPPADSDKNDTDKPAEEKKDNAPARDLVKEVIAKHLASLPTLK